MGDEGTSSKAEKDLLRIGFWYSEEDPQYIHPEALQSPGFYGEEKQKIVNYLRTAEPVTVWCDYAECRFDCGVAEEEMGSGDNSDGIWIWPEGLYHYVESHDVRLPKQFLETIRSNNYQPPEDWREGRGSEDEDDSFWLEWCRRQDEDGAT